MAEKARGNQVETSERDGREREDGGKVGAGNDGRAARITRALGEVLETTGASEQQGGKKKVRQGSEGRR